MCIFSGAYFQSCDYIKYLFRCDGVGVYILFIQAKK